VADSVCWSLCPQCWVCYTTPNICSSKPWSQLPKSPGPVATIAHTQMTSKHPNAGVLIRRGLYDNLHSFADLEQRISALGDENSKAVGDAFEVFVEGYLATHQKLQAEAVWLVGQVPQGIRERMNLPNDAKGIDGIFRTRTGVLVPYQVKFRSQRAYLTYTEI